MRRKTEKIILVNKAGKKTGEMEKLKAHLEGRLHRAFSIFIFNSKGELLMQKRAKKKYHSAKLWSNTCCSHPRPGENIITAAHRRLEEEMGFDCRLKKVFSFVYCAKVNDRLAENELDNVFIGLFDGDPIINREEASGWKWMDLKKLKKDLKKNPSLYTYWLKIAILKFENKISSGLNKFF